MVISSQIPYPIRNWPRTGFPGESNAFHFDAVAVAELQCAGRPSRRVDREEFAPYPVHLAVILRVGEHDGHLDDAVEARPGGFEHVRHVSQGLPNLLCDRAEITPAGERVRRPGPPALMVSVFSAQIEARRRGRNDVAHAVSNHPAEAACASGRDPAAP
jgi:hypothetical protein